MATARQNWRFTHSGLESNVMTQRRTLALLILCLLTAAILRLPDLANTPPGLHYDEAANAILAGDIGLRGDRPLFIESYTGKEVLFFYLAGGLMRLVGESVFTLRLTAAYVGLLTVAAAYWLGRELLADRRMALMATVLLAISFWHVLFSRLGFRAITEPLLQALAVAALFRGLKREQWAWCVAGGVFLGLAAYTYLAVRVFPVVLLIALVPFLLNRARFPGRVAQIGLFGLAALVVALPLLLYFYSHPQAFWVRISQVGPAGSTPNLLQTYLESLGMFFLLGDPYWRFNLPGRALFNWFWGGLLLVGWLTMLLRWRRWWYDWQKAAVVLLLLTPFIMILPTSLAVNEIVPSNLRAIGLIPFIFYLPAVGLVHLLEMLADYLRRPDLPAARLLQRLRLLQGYEVNYALVAGLTLLLGGYTTGRAYFQTWATRTDLFYDADADLAATARYLDQQDTTGRAIYVAALHYRHPTLAFLSNKYDQVRWLPQSQALVFPAGTPALYLFPHNSPAPDWATPFLPSPQPGPAGPDGQPLYTAYWLDNPPELAISQPVDASFGQTITLLGYDVAPAGAGTTLPLTLYWRVNAPPAGALTPFVHLEDTWGHRWSQVEPFGYPAEQWLPGDLIIQRVDVPVPHGTPPGPYRLRVGLFDPSSGARLPRLDSAGRYAGDAYLIEPATVLRSDPPRTLPTPPRGRPYLVRPGLQILGYERGDFTLSNGETLFLALWWHATAPQPRLTSRLELRPSDGPGRVLLDSEPVHNTYPFSQWVPPQFIIDRLDPTIPNDLPAGQYTLDYRLLDEAGDTLIQTQLGSITVRATARSFTPPPISHPLDAAFGSEIKLLGYDLAGSTTGQYHLRLIWQAIAPPAADYTIFVHLLHPDGTCCPWQADNYPRQGSYPTSRWLTGEVVVEEYDIVLPDGLPAGSYPLEVGLYLAETGQRLVVSQPGLPDSDIVLLRPINH